MAGAAGEPPRIVRRRGLLFLLSSARLRAAFLDDRAILALLATDESLPHPPCMADKRGALGEEAARVAERVVFSPSILGRSLLYPALLAGLALNSR